jgi:hypothetical protein
MTLAKRYTGSLGKALVGVKPSETVVTPIVAQCQDDSWIPTCEGALFKLCLSGDFLLARLHATVNIPVRLRRRGVRAIRS